VFFRRSANPLSPTGSKGADLLAQGASSPHRAAGPQAGRCGRVRATGWHLCGHGCGCGPGSGPSNAGMCMWSACVRVLP